ncbi:beta subunit of citrate lyase [Biscogniauxia sp. FL1348]|nr:beta subunit of citrate lyase [Biscogniauxia sp. FL1348]
MAAKTSTVLRRAMLYVPASSPRMLSKSLGLVSDNITYDLEDSVTPGAKASARAALRAHLESLSGGARPAGVGELAVRINAVTTAHALADLSAVAASPRLDAVVVPKVERAGDLKFVAQALRHLAPERHRHRPRHHRRLLLPDGEPSPDGGGGSDPALEPPPPIKLLALIESARAVTDLRSICAAAPGQLSGLIFAAEDFALDLSLARTPSLREFLYARSAIVTAARAARLPSTIDLVCTSYRGGGDGDDEALARLEDECRDGRGLGFNGKQCIHPSQVDTVQRLFAPGEAEVEWAVRVVVADGKAARAGRGAWTLDGHMIDAPVVGKAKATIEKARACGMDVEALRERWKDQKPE